MNIKKITSLIITVVLSFSVLLFIIINNQHKFKINMVEVNDISQSITENWNNLNKSTLSQLAYDIDYVVLDMNNQLLWKTRDGLNEDLNSAISNYDAIIDIKSNEILLGKLIIYNNTNENWIHFKGVLITYSVIIICLMGIFCLIYGLYINKTIILPFNKLKGFAKHVAEGNLDLPLQMDKSNLFGAFSESFDLMRDELKKAKEEERKANQSKKELVASLSHDIKTPIASIKAVSELMQIKSEDEYIRKQLKIIDAKADQINTLITNMFNATLEELQELKVTISEESSTIIYDLIKEADYNHQVTITNKSECIVVMDSLRLAQVVDNIISNSYKYANTSVSVSININDRYLEVIFKDYGLGVDQNELPLIFNKFYRAQNSQGKDGSGLGLYISKYLMNKMQGDIECENSIDGFIVRLKLLIA